MLDEKNKHVHHRVFEKFVKIYNDRDMEELNECKFEDKDYFGIFVIKTIL